MGVIGRVMGRTPPGGLTIPGGPLGLTGCPGAAALGLALGRLPGRAPAGPAELAFSHSSVTTVSAVSVPSIICYRTSACLCPFSFNWICLALSRYRRDFGSDMAAASASSIYSAACAA